MNLAQLQYFKKLAELQHYTKTAKELYITQPSLSDSISSLESELGTQLFQKEGRNVKLTKIGKEFYYYVSSCLNELDTGIAMIKERSEGLGGSIQIGCIPTLLNDFLPTAISGYVEEKNPKAKLHIHQGHTFDIITGLNSGIYDLGFCSKPPQDVGLTFIPIHYQPFIIIVSNKHPLASKDKVTLEELRSYEIFTYREDLPIGHNILSILKEAKLRYVPEFDGELSIAGFVNCSKRVGLVADTSYLKQFDGLVRISIADIPKDLHLVYMAYKQKTFICKTTESFADYVIAKKLNLPD